MDISEAIEVAFCDGKNAPENAVCPHHPATLAAHWWTRGFAYTARLYRALVAEQRLIDAIAAEREACAQIADSHECGVDDDFVCQHQNCAACISGGIRARSNAK